MKGWSGADWHGHGTHIASLIGGDAIQTPYGTFEGVAPDAQILSIKAFDVTGFTSTSTIVPTPTSTTTTTSTTNTLSTLA